MGNEAAKTPDYLGKCGKEFWKAVSGYVDLETVDYELLRTACEAIDKSDTARRRLDRDGLVVEDRFGRPVEHPAFKLWKQARELFVRARRELGLDSAVEPARGQLPPGYK